MAGTLLILASLYSRLAVPFHLNILKDEKVVENYYRFNKRVIPRGAKCESLGRDLALERKKNAGKKEPCRFFRFQNRWMGSKGPNRPTSKGGIVLHVHEPLPRRGSPLCQASTI